jgi:hypothetical protein
MTARTGIINDTFANHPGVIRQEALGPLDSSTLRGLSSRGGHVSKEVRGKIIGLILEEADGLPEIDQAMLLAIAETESGFNPDAKAATTSASGVFQLVKATAESLGVFRTQVFNARENIRAGVKLYQEHQELIEEKYPEVKGDDKLALLYALHHDGPTLSYGGLELAWQRVIPRVPYWLEYVRGLDG